MLLEYPEAKYADEECWHDIAIDLSIVGQVRPFNDSLTEILFKPDGTGLLKLALIVNEPYNDVLPAIQHLRRAILKGGELVST